MGLLGGCTFLSLITLFTTMIIFITSYSDRLSQAKDAGFEDAQKNFNFQQTIDFFVFLVIAMVTFVGIFMKNKFVMIFVVLGSIVMVGLLSARIHFSFGGALNFDEDKLDGDFREYGDSLFGDCQILQIALDANEDDEETEKLLSGCRGGNTFRIFSLITVVFNLISSAFLVVLF